MRGDQFGDQLGELPELNQAGGRVVPEVAFGERTQRNQLGIMRSQKAEVRGLHSGTTPLSRNDCIILRRLANPTWWSAPARKTAPISHQFQPPCSGMSDCNSSLRQDFIALERQSGELVTGGSPDARKGPKLGSCG